MNDETLAKASDAWLNECRRLGVRIQAPFSKHSVTGCFKFIAYLPDFGGPTGMVIGGMDLPAVKPDDQVIAVATDNGWFISFINVTPFARGVATEADFLDALTDWGYFGPASSRPNWLPEH